MGQARRGRGAASVGRVAAVRVALSTALVVACGGAAPADVDRSAPASPPREGGDGAAAAAAAPPARAASTARTLDSPAGAPGSARSTGEPADPAGEVMIRRTLCYGTCPAYTAYIDTEGRVFYHGRAYVERLGIHTGRVDPADVAALVDLTEANGYWRVSSEHERRITDNATVHTAVVHDGRRQWVRNYANAAPPAVGMTETAIDALLEYVTWDAEPHVEPVEEDSCVLLGTAIAERCAWILTLMGRGGDCPHWFAAWDSLASGDNVDASGLELRCARTLRSLEMAPSPPIRRHSPIPWGPKCRRWNRDRVGACHAALLGGDVDRAPCAQAMYWTDVQIEGYLRLSDKALSLRVAEYFCGRWTRE